VPWLLAIVGVVVHLPFVARFPTEWDSVQLVFGVDRFDVTDASPHAPGYWLYLGLGRLVRWATPLDAHDSLVACSALAAGVTVALAYVLGRSMGGRWLGVAAAGVMLSSPFLLFYGSSVGTYAFDALAVETLLLLAWKAQPGSWHGAGAAAALGLAGGFRQSSLLLLAPVAVVAVVRSSRARGRLVGHAAAVAGAGLAGVAVWLVPMAVEQPGGLATVQRYGARIWREAVSVSSPVYGAPGAGVAYNIGQAAGYTLAAVALLLPALAIAVALRVVQRRRFGRTPDSAPTPGWGLGAPALLALAVVGPLAFVLVFHFGKAGYVLSYLPALVLLALWPAVRLTGPSQLVVTVLVVVACVVSAQRFATAPGILPLTATDRGGPWFTESRFGAPYRLTAQAIDDVDSDTDRYLPLAERLDPRSDVLVYVYLNGGHRFRQAMFTMANFRAHYLQLGRDEFVGFRRRWERPRDTEVELPRGGRAVFVVDEPREDLSTLAADGRAEAIVLDTGPTVYAVGAGSTVFGVALVDASVPSA